MRAKLAPAIVCAIERARIVFAVPGTSSSRTWPPLVRAESTSVISSCLPRTTCSMFAISRSATSTADARLPVSAAIWGASATVRERYPVGRKRSAARNGQLPDPGRGRRAHGSRPRAQVDGAARRRCEAREVLADVLPEVQRLPANRFGEHHREVAARVRPLLRERADDALRPRHADDEAFVDRAGVRSRLRERVPRPGAELD